MTIDELARGAAAATRRTVSESIDIEDALDAVTKPSHRGYGRAVMAAAVAAAIVAVTILAFEMLSSRSAPPVKQPAPPTITQTEIPTPDKIVWHGPFYFDLVTEKRTPLPERLQRMSANNFRVSPDGTQLAFTTARSIWVADIDGSHVRQVGPGETAGVYVPAVATGVDWSPDGNSLVYSRGGQIYVNDLDTGRSTKLRDSDSYNFRDIVYDLNFHPDGQKILFTGWHDGALALWTIPATGGQAELLLDYAAFGSYSPDGSTIAFRRTDFDPLDSLQNADPNIFLADADGSHVRSPTDAGSGRPHVRVDALWPMWSPDGEWLAYEARYGNDSTTVMNVTTNESFTIPHAVYPSWLDNHTLIMMRTH